MAASGEIALKPQACDAYATLGVYAALAEPERLGHDHHQHAVGCVL
jgi:hypothetical protein